jgi:hypothetical protein
MHRFTERRGKTAAAAGPRSALDSKAPAVSRILAIAEDYFLRA